MSNDNLSFGLVSVARAPLEGRASAMATLDAALDAVEKQKQPRIVTIVGPAGIGKSRLVHEFVVRHRGGSALVPRVYRGSARDSNAAYGVFFAPGGNGKAHFDLPAFCAARLAALGIEAEISPHDTYVDPARWHSARRAGHQGDPDYGRNCAAIAL